MTFAADTYQSEVIMEKIFDIVHDALEDIRDTLDLTGLESISPDTRLFGTNGNLTSMALVSLITDVEERISEVFNQEIVLADERAMSQRLSPFRSVRALSAYLQRLLKEPVK